jgi:hypothetical protein
MQHHMLHNEHLLPKLLLLLHTPAAAAAGWASAVVMR